ncbi:hypothetical protein ACLK12_12575 [Escherichia coli]
MAGTVDIAIAGGADSSSVLPIGVSKTLARALVDLNKARNLQQRFDLCVNCGSKDLLPVPPAVQRDTPPASPWADGRADGQEPPDQP